MISGWRAVTYVARPSGLPPAGEGIVRGHFALGENLGDRAVIDRHAIEAGVDVAALHTALESGVAYGLVDRAEAMGRSVGVRGTPAWLVGGRLVPGLYSREQFEQLAEALAP